MYFGLPNIDAATFKQVVFPVELCPTRLNPQFATSQIFSNRLAKPRQTENVRREFPMQYFATFSFHSSSVPF
jgi:hypothetical protein